MKHFGCLSDTDFEAPKFHIGIVHIWYGIIWVDADLYLGVYVFMYLMFVVAKERGRVVTCNLLSKFYHTTYILLSKYAV